jgi:hypothetical protein
MGPSGANGSTPSSFQPSAAAVSPTPPNNSLPPSTEFTARRLRQMQTEAEANYRQSLAAYFDEQERASGPPPMPAFTVWQHLLSAAVVFAIVAASFGVIVLVADAVRFVVRFLMR